AQSVSEAVRARLLPHLARGAGEQVVGPDERNGAVQAVLDRRIDLQVSILIVALPPGQRVAVANVHPGLREGLEDSNAVNEMVESELPGVAPRALDQLLFVAHGQEQGEHVDRQLAACHAGHPEMTAVTSDRGRGASGSLECGPNSQRGRLTP